MLQPVPEDGSIRTWLWPSWVAGRCLVVRFPQKPALVEHTEMTRFHTDDYVNFLRVVTPDNKGKYLRELHKCT